MRSIILSLLIASTAFADNIHIHGPDGYMLDVYLYTLGSDTEVDSTGVSPLTQETNRDGLYIWTGVTGVTGVHYVEIEDNGDPGTVVATGYVTLKDDGGNYVVADHYASPVIDEDVSAIDVDATTIGTVTTLTDHTPQTGDSYARLGAPAGASIAADIATVDGVVDDILTDTGTAGVVLATGGITSTTFGTGAITAAAIATNAIGAAELATGAIGAAEIADGAIDAATFAADVDAEVLGYLVDDATQIDASALNTLSSHDPGATIGTSTVTTAQVNTEVDNAIKTYHLDHLLAVDYDPELKPGVATALLNELVVSDAGVSQLSTNALENAPSGGGGGDATEANQTTIIGHLTDIKGGTWSDENLVTIDANIDAILDDTGDIGVAGAGLTEAGGTGDQFTALPDVVLADSASHGGASAVITLSDYSDFAGAADPAAIWGYSLPGALGVGTAGYQLSDAWSSVSAGTITVTSTTVNPSTLVIVRGDDYGGTGQRAALTWSVDPATADFTGYTTVTITVRDRYDSVVYSNTDGSVTDAGGAGQTVSVPIDGDDTASLTASRQCKYDVEVKSATWTYSVKVGSDQTCWIVEDQTRP